MRSVRFSLRAAAAALPRLAFNASVMSSRSNDSTIEMKSTSSPYGSLRCMYAARTAGVRL